MALDLSRLADDILHDDEDIRLLALQTLMRVGSEQLCAQPQVVDRIKADLQKLITTAQGDQRFFARQAVDHIGRHGPGKRAEAPTGRTTGGFTAVRPPEAVAAAAPQAPPAASLASSEPSVVLDELKRLAAAPDSTARPDVLALLGRNLGPEVTSSALAVLARIGRPEDWGAVAGCLKASDGRVRANAVEVAEVLLQGAPRVEALIGLVGDPVDRVKANVLKALGALSEDVVAKSLDQMLTSPSVASRVSAVYVLGQLRGDKMIELLWKAARDPSEQVRVRVVTALRVHRHPQVQDILKRLTKDIDISICEAALDVLTDLCTHAVEDTDAAAEVDRVGSVESLGSKESRILVEALRRIERDRTRTARPAVLGVLTQNRDPVVLAQAVMTLSWIATVEDANVLARFLGHPNDRIRANAVEAVVRTAPREAAAKVLVGLLADRDNRVRGNVIRALAEMGVQGLEGRIMDMLGDADVNMRLSAVWAGSYIRPERIMPAMLRASSDPVPDVRRKVVEILDRFPLSRDLVGLVHKLSKDLDVGVRTRANELHDRLRKAAGTSMGRAASRMEATSRDLDENPGQPSSTPAAGPNVLNLTGPIVLQPRPPEPSPSAAAPGIEATIEAPLPRPEPQVPSMEATVEVPRSVVPSTGAPEAGGGIRPRALQTRSRGTTRTRAVDVQKAGAPSTATLDDLYDRLDRELEEMGRKIYRLQADNKISEPAFSKSTYQIKRLDDLLKKREDGADRGLLARLPFFRAAQKDPATLQLEFNLSEEFRRLGETAIELYHGLDRSFPDVEDHYGIVDELLLQVKDLKGTPSAETP